MITIIYLIQLDHARYIWLSNYANYDSNLSKVLDEGIDELCYSYALDRTEFDFYAYQVDEEELNLNRFTGNTRPDALIYTNIYFENGEPIHHHPLLDELFESHQESLEDMFDNLNLTT